MGSRKGSIEPEEPTGKVENFPKEAIPAGEHMATGAKAAARDAGEPPQNMIETNQSQEEEHMGTGAETASTAVEPT